MLEMRSVGRIFEHTMHSMKCKSCFYVPYDIMKSEYIMIWNLNVLNILLFWEGVVVLMRTFGLDNARMWSLVFFCQFINHIC